MDRRSCKTPVGPRCSKVSCAVSVAESASPRRLFSLPGEQRRIFAKAVSSEQPGRLDSPFAELSVVLSIAEAKRVRAFAVQRRVFARKERWPGKTAYRR